MAPRLPAGIARLAGLIVLSGLAAAAPAPGGPRQAGAPSVGGWLSLVVLAALAVPALILAVIAVVRYRTARVPVVHEYRRRGNPWLGALILAGLLAIAVAAMVLRFWILLAPAAVIIGLALAALNRHRAAQPEPEPPPGVVVSETRPRMVRRPAGDPRSAIIECYAALEDALGEVPEAIPRPADSPSEVLGRAEASGAVRSPAAWRLVELFDEARFSRHPMTEPDRAIAEAALRTVLAELGATR